MADDMQTDWLEFWNHPRRDTWIRILEDILPDHRPFKTIEDLPQKWRGWILTHLELKNREKLRALAEKGGFFPQKSLFEMATSLKAARLRQEWLLPLLTDFMSQNPDASLWDLTAGQGVDLFSFLETGFFKSAMALDADPFRADLLATQPFLANFSLQISSCRAESRDLPEKSIILLDPARRDDSGKRVDWVPDPFTIAENLPDSSLMVLKLSPLFDIREGLRVWGPKILSAWSLSTDGEVRENGFLISGRPQRREPLFAALTSTGILTGKPNFAPLTTGTEVSIQPGNLILIPDPAIRMTGLLTAWQVAAGNFLTLGAALVAEKLSENLPGLKSAWQILEICPHNRQTLRKFKDGADILRIPGLNLPPAEVLRKSLGTLKEGRQTIAPLPRMEKILLLRPLLLR